MPYPHDEPPWTSQRTRALFRLFQTSAPPDFQRPILERLAQRQHAQERRRLGGWSLLAWWPGCRAWGGGRLQPHRRWPGHVIAMVGCCGLVLGTSLTWWAVRVGPTAPPVPAPLVPRAVTPLPRAPGVPVEASGRLDHNGGFGRAERQEAAVHAAGPLESSTSAPQIQMEPSVARDTASQAGDDPERALLVPAPVRHFTAQKEHQPPAYRYTPRSGRPRAAPGKPSRPHTRPETGQQEPG
jgi:hypothetical protein